MKNIHGINARLFFIFSLLLPAASLCEETAPGSIKTVPDSRNQIVRLTDRGLEPSTMTIKKDDSIVFFLNDTADSLTTLEIDFGEKHAHCSSTNLIISSFGKIKSQRPFGPNDFSSTCFHEKGTYPFVIYGLKSKPAGMAGQIIVEQ